MVGRNGDVGRRQRLLSSRALGEENRARVLRLLVDNGPLARATIAQLTGVARATISTIVQGLIEDDLLVELKPLETGNVGKPATPVWFRPGAGAVVAVELRPGVVRAALVDARGELSAPVALTLANPASGDEVNRTATAAVAEVLAAGVAIGVGIAVPGTVDLDSSEVLGSSQVPGSVGTALVAAVSRSAALPTFLENDSRAQALAERWFGGGRGVSSYASLQTGEGLGVGLVLDEAIHRGPHGVAGELGHTTVVIGGDRCSCGHRGCWETVATLRWLRKQAAAHHLPRPRSIDCARLVALAEAGRPGAVELLGAYADNLSVGIANLNHLLGIELVILHGDVIGGGPTFIDELGRRVDPRSLHRPTRLVASELGDDSTLLGAAATVLADVLHLPR